MTRSNLLLLGTFFIMVAVIVVACSDDDEAGEWEPVDDDDDDTADDDDDDDNNNTSDCPIELEDWRYVAEACPMQIQAKEDGEMWSAVELFEMCDSCLVDCFDLGLGCSTKWSQCSFTCDLS